ncbi:MAG: PAS domain-containing protein [Cyanobacteriota bacterium]
MPSPAPELSSLSSEDRSWLWTLFVCGAASHSARALAAIHKLCENVQPDRVELRIKDIRRNPAAALEAGVLAVPCLVCSPPPQLRDTNQESSSCEALQRRIDQLEAALNAITNGRTDVLLVGANGPAGNDTRFFLPQGAHEPYRDIVEQMADGIGTLSADGRLLFANPRLAALLDRPAETLLGRPLGDLLHPSQRASLLRLCRVTPGRSERAEFELQQNQGEPIRVLAEVSGLKGAGIASHCLTLTDLSDLTGPATARADDEHRARLLAETVSAFLMETDGDHQVAWVSASVQSVLGWSPQELLGICLNSLLHPEEALEAEHAFWQHQPLLRLRTKQGVYRWMRLRSGPHRGEGPIACRWLIAFQDAGELVGQQQSRDFDQDRLADVLMTPSGPQIVLRAVRLPDGGVADFICTAANTAAYRRYGLAPPTLVGRRLHQAFSAHVAVVVHALCQQALQSDQDMACGEIAEPSGANAEERRSSLRVVRVGDVLICCWEGVEAGKLRCQEIPPPLELVSPTQLIETLSRRHPPGSRQTRPLAFALCDLRNFRVIHETHGAESAEQVLEVIESRVRQILQEDAIVARISEDQLLIAFDGMDNQKQAIIVAESIRVVISLPLPIPEGSPRIVPSVSIRLQQPGECMKALLRGVVEDGIPVRRVNRS